MTRLPLEALEACAADFDASVERDPSIDRFCSRTEWILPFLRAFLPERELFAYRNGGSFLAFAAREHPTVGRYLEAIETMWCFACPLVGEESVPLLEQAISEIGANAPLVFAGIPANRGPETLLARVVVALDDRYDLRVVDSTLRFEASLEGGLEGWLSRRSRAFRRNLRAAARKAEGEIEMELHRPGPGAQLEALYERVLDIERRSWKAAEGSGVAEAPMRTFYDDMLPRIARRGGMSS